MRPTSVARWVSEEKIIRRIVFSSGVAQSASFGERLVLSNKTTHDGDRDLFAQTKMKIRAPMVSAFLFRIRSRICIAASGYEAGERVFIPSIRQNSNIRVLIFLYSGIEILRRL